METHGPWRIVASREVYRDPWLALRQDDVIRPDGHAGTYSVVHLNPGVCVLAIDEQQRVYLTEEFHYGVGRVTWEGVSGGIEASETADATARRELREELGITARHWQELGVMDPLTGSLVSPTRLYLARDLEFGPVAHEGTEVIRSVCMPLHEAVQHVIDSRITHGPSCVLILKAARALGA